jgi:hypothetical protein
MGTTTTPHFSQSPFYRPEKPIMDRDAEESKGLSNLVYFCFALVLLVSGWVANECYQIVNRPKPPAFVKEPVVPEEHQLAVGDRVLVVFGTLPQYEATIMEISIDRRFAAIVKFGGTYYSWIDVKDLQYIGPKPVADQPETEYSYPPIPKTGNLEEE